MRSRGTRFQIGCALLAVLLCSALGAARGGVAPFSLTVDKFELPGAFRLSGLVAVCTRLRVAAREVVCEEGTLDLRDSPLGRLRIPLQGRSDGRHIQFATKPFPLLGGRLSLSFEGDGDEARLHVRLADAGVPLVHERIKSLWPGVPLFELHDATRGTLDLDLDCNLGRAASSPRECAARGRIAALDVVGPNSASDATLQFQLSTERDGDRDRWSGRFELAAGGLYLEPGLEIGGLTPGLLLKVEDAPIVADVTFTRESGGRIGIERGRLHHPGVADFAFDGYATLQPNLTWSAAQLRFSTNNLARFYDTYLQPLLLGGALGDLRAQGRLEVELRAAGGRVAELEVACSRCGLEDEHGRFGVNGLDGGLRLHDGADARYSTLSWAGASFYRIEFGPGRIGWRSARGALETVDWQDVAIFDGALHLDDMRLEEFGSPRMKFVLAGSIAPITLSKLTTRLGWIPLAGSITGALPNLTISRGRIAIDGDLDIGVFDGHVVFSDLRVTDVLGAAPRLRADIHIRGLDLAQLTSTFAFGNITGHLDGEIADLRLEAWQPVSFDAFVGTPEDDPVPHRISRQAVDNLSRIGAGTGGPLASGWLGLIPSYSFGRLGFGCRLANGICHLRGAEATPDGGFKLLTRGGWLPPWIEIRGAGELVAWRTLVDGVDKIVRGDAEIEINVGRAEARPAEQEP